MYMEYVLCNSKTGILKDAKNYLTYFDILSNIVEKVPTNGMTIAEMKRDFSLLDKLSTLDDSLTLSEDEYSRIEFLLEDTKWTIKHRDIVVFYDYFNSLKNK